MVGVTTAAVRLADKSGKHLGCATVLNGEWLATCLHVVKEAEFNAHFADGSLASARVVASNLAADLALLRLVRYPVALSLSLPFSLTEERRGSVTLFGFSEADLDGYWLKGELRGDRRDGKIQIEFDSRATQPLDLGFSGCPVFDETETRILGLFSALRRKGDEPPYAGLMIPATALVTLCKSQRLDLPTWVPDDSASHSRRQYARHIADAFAGTQASKVGITALQGVNLRTRERIPSLLEYLKQWGRAEGGDRIRSIGLMAPDGAGKKTLIRVLQAELAREFLSSGIGRLAIRLAPERYERLDFSAALREALRSVVPSDDCHDVASCIMQHNLILMLEKLQRVLDCSHPDRSRNILHAVSDLLHAGVPIVFDVTSPLDGFPPVSYESKQDMWRAASSPVDYVVVQPWSKKDALDYVETRCPAYKSSSVAVDIARRPIGRTMLDTALQRIGSVDDVNRPISMSGLLQTYIDDLLERDARMRSDGISAETRLALCLRIAHKMAMEGVVALDSGDVESQVEKVVGGKAAWVVRGLASNRPRRLIRSEPDLSGRTVISFGLPAFLDWFVASWIDERLSQGDIEKLEEFWRNQRVVRKDWIRFCSYLGNRAGRCCADVLLVLIRRASIGGEGTRLLGAFAATLLGQIAPEALAFVAPRPILSDGRFVNPSKAESEREGASGSVSAVLARTLGLAFETDPAALTDSLRLAVDNQTDAHGVWRAAEAATAEALVVSGVLEALWLGPLVVDSRDGLMKALVASVAATREAVVGSVVSNLGRRSEQRPLAAAIWDGINDGAWTALWRGCPYLNAADLSGVTLRGLRLSEARLDGVSFEGADLTNADLSGSSLVWADLRHAKGLDSVNFANSNWYRAHLAPRDRASLKLAWRSVESDEWHASLPWTNPYS